MVNTPESEENNPSGSCPKGWQPHQLEEKSPLQKTIVYGDPSSNVASDSTQKTGVAVTRLADFMDVRNNQVSEEKILDVALAVFQTSVSAWRNHMDAPYVASRDVAFWTGQFQNTYETIRKQIKSYLPVDKKSES